MAVTGKSSADRTSRWEVLLTNLKPSVPDMPHVAEDVKSLEGHLAQARALESQQEDLRSQARKITADLQLLLSAGDKVRSRLGANLKGKFGFTDKTLGKYGFKARSTAPRKRKSTPQPPPPPVPAPPPVELKPGTPGQGTPTGTPVPAPKA